MSEVKIGPWTIEADPSQSKSNLPKVSLHGIEVPNLVDFVVESNLKIMDVTTSFDSQVRSSPGRTTCDLTIKVSFDPNDDFSPIPKEFVKDHVLNELMERILFLERERSSLLNKLKNANKS